MIRKLGALLTTLCRSVDTNIRPRVNLSVGIKEEAYRLGVYSYLLKRNNRNATRIFTGQKTDIL